MTPIGLGFRAVRGGSVVVGVAVDGPDPRVVLSTFLLTAAEGDRLSLEPYHVAAEMERGPHGGVPARAAAAIAEGRRRQGLQATKGLDDIIGKLREARYEPVIAALLVNRAGWLTDDLKHCLSGVEHARVAEGLAVRDAVRVALDRSGLECTEMDEKTLQDAASTALHRSSDAIDRRLVDLGATVGRPWRKEQKRACLSAWVALTARR